MGSRLRAVDAAGIERIIDDYRRAALLAVEAGFDSIEVHVGHNYLLSAFLSPKLNRRDDQFGGSVENRARFARPVLQTVRDAVGPTWPSPPSSTWPTASPGGLWLDESVEVAAPFEADGVLDALELTGGSSLANPMYLFRGEAPLQEFGATLPRPVRLGFKLVGSRFLGTTPSRRPSSSPTPASSGPRSRTRSSSSAGSPSWRRFSPRSTEGFAFVAMARALLREPDLPNRMQDGSTASSLCIHCNKCMPTIYSGTRCVLVADRPASA